MAKLVSKTYGEALFELVLERGTMDLTLEEVETAAGIVQEAANPDANIIFGATSSDEFEDEMRVTVIATGFEQKEAEDESKASGTGAKVSDDIDDIFKIFKN